MDPEHHYCPTCHEPIVEARRGGMPSHYLPCGHPFAWEGLRGGEVIHALPQWFVERKVGGQWQTMGLHWQRSEAERDVDLAQRGSQTEDVRVRAVLVTWALPTET